MIEREMTGTPEAGDSFNENVPNGSPLLPEFTPRASYSEHDYSRMSRLFSHVSTEHAITYRAIMDVFAKAKEQYRLQLRPDEVLNEVAWPSNSPRPEIDQVTQHLDALVKWGNLEAQQDMTRWSSIEDFKRNYKIYRLSRQGEAVEAGLQRFVEALRQRAELQTVALADIENLLRALVALNRAPALDVPKVHGALRDLTSVFATMTENAAAFMAGVDRSLGPTEIEFENVEHYKNQLIDYLQRFVSDLARQADTIAGLIQQLDHSIEDLLFKIAERQAQDAAPGTWGTVEAKLRYRDDWKSRWLGLRRWFASSSNEPSTADLLRQKARSAIRQLAIAIKEINDRTAGRSDRSADLRMLAGWFLACETDTEAHLMCRVAFGLNPARHFSLNTNEEELIPAGTPWAEAPALRINPRLYKYGDGPQRGQLPAVKDRSAERAAIQQRLADEVTQALEARRRFTSAHAMRLSEVGTLSTNEFALFLGLLGEALDHQGNPDNPVEIVSGDGTLIIRLVPLGPESRAQIATQAGMFSGRDHVIIITPSYHG